MVDYLCHVGDVHDGVMTLLPVRATLMRPFPSCFFSAACAQDLLNVATIASGSTVMGGIIAKAFEKVSFGWTRNKTRGSRCSTAFLRLCLVLSSSQRAGRRSKLTFAARYVADRRQPLHRKWKAKFSEMLFEERRRRTCDSTVAKLRVLDIVSGVVS